MANVPRLPRLPAFAVALFVSALLPPAAAAANDAARFYGDGFHAAVAQRVPGFVFCAYYDRGGEGVAYHDTEAENQGSGKLNPPDGSYLNEFRLREGVDVSYTKQLPDLDSPCNRVVPPLGLLYVGWNEPGEWFRLSIDAAAAGTYVADVLYTSNRGGTIGIDVNGALAASFSLTSTFDPAETIPWRQWHHWNVARDAFAVSLPKGVSVLTVHIVSGGNLNLATFGFRPQGTPRDDAGILAANTPSPQKTWRPFADTSPWNQPIPARPALDPASRKLIDDFASRGSLHVNIRDWSIPVYFVDADRTPKHDVGDFRPGVYGAGFEFPRQIPIPDDAVASPPYIRDSDNHLCIVDQAKHLEWGLWLAQKDAAGRWFTGLGAVTDLSGSGVAPPWFANARDLDSHRARAGGFPLIAGLMLLDEIKAGRINHALVFAYDHCRSSFFVPPASTSQGDQRGAIDSRGIPMGGRIQLDPAWDVEHSGLSANGKIIARALQDYGAYCGDYAGGNVIYAENSPAAVAAWQGVLDTKELSAVFTPEMIRKNFRVLDMGNILPGQNLKVRPPYVIAFAVAGETAPARIDQLHRTIVVSPPPRKLTATWTLYPQDARVTIDGHATAQPGAEIDLTRETTLTVIAASGATSSWKISAARKTAP